MEEDDSELDRLLAEFGIPDDAGGTQEDDGLPPRLDDIDEGWD